MPGFWSVWWLVVLFMMSVPLATFAEGSNEVCAVRTASAVTDAALKFGHCSKDEECVVINLDCPFGCTTVINKSEVSSLTELLAQFRANERSCGRAACNYQCAVVTDAPRCRDNQCVWVPTNPPGVAPKHQGTSLPLVGD